MHNDECVFAHYVLKWSSVRSNLTLYIWLFSSIYTYLNHIVTTADGPPHSINIGHGDIYDAARSDHIGEYNLKHEVVLLFLMSV